MSNLPRKEYFILLVILIYYSLYKQLHSESFYNRKERQLFAAKNEDDNAKFSQQIKDDQELSSQRNKTIFLVNSKGETNSKTSHVVNSREEVNSKTSHVVNSGEKVNPKTGHVVNKSKYEWQMLKWREAYLSGAYADNSDIAHRVFGKPLPRHDTRCGAKPRKKGKIISCHHSYPFLTQDTLRTWIDWELKGDNRPNNPLFLHGLAKNQSSKFSDGDSIYVAVRQKNIFVAWIARHLPNKHYILVTGKLDSEAPGPTEAKQLLKSPRLIRWFTINPSIVHPKVEAMPIGIDYGWGKGVVKIDDANLLSQVLLPEVPFYHPGHVGNQSSGPGDSGNENSRPILSYINFNYSPGKSKERLYARNSLANMSKIADDLSLTDYVNDVKASKFMVSPPGFGWDCFRTWEAVLFGSIPIVLYKKSMAKLYAKSPVMVVDRWKDVTREKLLNFQVNTTSKDIIFVDYWLDRIEEVKQRWKKQKKLKSNKTLNVVKLNYEKSVL